MLFATGTTLSVPALTGAIMCMGVATANSILVVAFARERLAAHGRCGAGSGGSRLHPFPSRLMTALAMIIGMRRWRWAWAKAASRMRPWAAP